MRRGRATSIIDGPPRPWHNPLLEGHVAQTTRAILGNQAPRVAVRRPFIASPSPLPRDPLPYPLPRRTGDEQGGQWGQGGQGGGGGERSSSLSLHSVCICATA
jgi:hypothetical protein